jgi:AcrR family transcriptional regulator
VAELSLRPLAAAIGSSPRVLLFLFGSKDALVKALLARARQDELELLSRARTASEEGDLGVVAAELWRWLTAEEHQGLLKLWIEGYARSVLDARGPWGGFARTTVSDWLELLAGAGPRSQRATPAREADRTLVLAVLRGALLDLLATGDRERTTAAVTRHLELMRQGSEPAISSQTRPTIATPQTRPTIATVGVYGATLERFLDALARAGVRTVLDVRQRRGVRGPEYAWANSQRLQRALADAGLGYRHLRAFAPTTELRHLQYAVDAASGVGKRSRTQLAPEYAERYRREILDHADLGVLLDALPDPGIGALLCVERDPEACHRSLIAERLASDYGFQVLDLRP